VGEPDQAFEWLFRTEYGPLVRTVYLVVRDAGRAEEIAQDAFTTLFLHWRRVSRYERPDAWVRRVALRLAIRHAKRERLRTVLERTAGAGLASSVRPDPGPGPDPDLAMAVAGLPPMQRACVVLCYFEDRPTDEIADILRIAPSTVRVHLTRARRHLAHRLGEEVSEDAG
jgi:RNA polymerase sigma-70 factor (ECF subfamily)